MARFSAQRDSRDMTTAASTRTGLDRFFEATSNSSFRRSDDKMVAGVCGAVATRLGVAPKFVRLAAVVLAFVSPMLAVYLLAWILLPDSSGRTVIERAVRGGQTSAIALTVVGGLLAASDLGIRVKVWPMLVLGAVIAAFALTARRRGAARGHHSAAQPAYPSPYGDSYAQHPASYSPYAQQPPAYGNTPQDAPRW